MQMQIRVSDRRTLLKAGALLALICTLISIALVHFRPRARGPEPELPRLQVNSGQTTVKFPHPAGAGVWRATAGGMLLCSQNPARFHIVGVEPQSSQGILSVHTYIRQFTIVSPSTGTAGTVSEPIIGAYGGPREVGGLDQPRRTWDELVGSIHPADNLWIAAPSCSRTTSAPGEEAAELLVVIRSDDAGGRVRHLVIAYDSGDSQARTVVPITIKACSTSSGGPNAGMRRLTPKSILCGTVTADFVQALVAASCGWAAAVPRSGRPAEAQRCRRRRVRWSPTAHRQMLRPE